METDVALLHGGDGYHKCGGVECKCKDCVVFGIIKKIVQGGIGFDDFNYKIAVGMKDG